MNINYVDTGRGEILQIDGAEIMFKNFSGRPTIYDREGGDRNFCLRIDDEDIANELISRGWNVKIKPARDPQEPPLMFMKVKVKFNNNGPNIYLVSGGAKAKLDEDSVSVLDNAYLLSCDLDIRPYNWEMNGRTGKSAYLQNMRAVQEVDRFADDFVFDSDDTF